MTWTVWGWGGVLVRYCCVPLSWDLSDVFLLVQLGLCVWGRETAGAECGFHGIVSRRPPVCVTATLVSRLGVLVKFSCEVPLWPFSTSALGKKAAPTSGVGVLLHLGAGQGISPLSLAPSAQGVCSPSYSFIQALIYIHAD